jgi:hypothetical protein
METSSTYTVNPLTPREDARIIPNRIELRCACGGCNLPFAYFENGMLVIVSWHDHQKHTNRIPLQMAITLTPPTVGENEALHCTTRIGNSVV